MKIQLHFHKDLKDGRLLTQDTMMIMFNSIAMRELTSANAECVEVSTTFKKINEKRGAEWILT